MTADAAITLVSLSCNSESQSPPDKPLNQSKRLNLDAKEENAKQSQMYAAKEEMRKTFNNNNRVISSYIDYSPRRL
jgi:hypothetical protein